MKYLVPNKGIYSENNFVPKYQRNQVDSDELTEEIHKLKKNLVQSIMVRVERNVEEVVNKYFSEIFLYRNNWEDFIEKIENIQPIVIYGLYDPRDWKLKYVGRTKNLRARVREHVLSTQKGIEKNEIKAGWLRELASLGLNPIISPLEYVDENDANEAEKFWIKKCDNGNLTNINNCK